MPPATSSGSSSASWIPLRDDYFETPLLSQKESAYLVRKSCEAAQEVVERARSSGGPIQWRHVEKYHDVQLYAGFSRGTYSAEPTSMCGVTSVPGSIKEIASLFDLPTTRAMKEFGRSHRDLFFDSVVLYTLSPRTREKPLHQVTAKWVATKCPKGMDHRDYCYLECQDKFMDSTGRKGWVLCLHSIKLPGCDELSREFGFVRGSFYHSGIVVVEADRPGYVDIIHMLQMNLKNNTKMPQAYLRERVAWISRLKGILRVKRLNEQRYLSDLELVPKKYRSRCSVCQDSFSLLLLRKMNCRKCGEVVCGACSKEFDVTNAKFLETIKLRICMHCYQTITAGQPTNVLDQPRASTSLSLLGYHDDNHHASTITEAMPGERTGLNPHSTNREGPTKIFLQSMRHHHDRRSSRRTRETDPGRRMQQPQPRAAYAPDPMSTDPGGRLRRSSRHHGAVPQPRSAPVGYDYNAGYDSRNLFDKPRGTGIEPVAPAPPQPEDPPVPAPPASLFDRRSSRSSRSSRNSGSTPEESSDVRRSEDIRASTKQAALPTTSPSRRSRLSTRDSRGAFKIPHSLYDYSALDPDASKPQPPSSPVRGRGNSTSSVSSTGSIDIDSYEVKKANGTNGSGANGTTAGGPLAASIDQAYHDVKTLVRAYPSVNDDDTEGSVGSGDDEPLEFAREKVPAQAPRASPTTYEEEEEETKSHEFEATPALPRPSRSAFTTTNDALMASGHSEISDVPFHRRNFNISDLSSVNCDTTYLDSEMRQFHGQPFYMRDGSDSRPTIDLSRASSGIAERGGKAPFVDGSVLRDSDVYCDSESVQIEPPTRTSPEKPPSMVNRPPLYGRPKKKENGPVEQQSNRSSETPSVAPNALLTEESILSRDSMLQSIKFQNGTMISMAPSSDSHEDLSFRDDMFNSILDDRDSEDDQSGNSERPQPSLLKPLTRPPTVPPRRAPPPPPPAYIPSRFQPRPSETTPEEQQQVVANHIDSTSVLDRESVDDYQPADIPTGPTKSGMEKPSYRDPQSNNQAEVDDVDFEELLRMPVSNQDDEAGRPTRRPVRAFQRSDTFDVANASAGHYGDMDDSSDSETEEERQLLSARRMYRKFNSSKRLAKVAGVSRDPHVQRTFEEIQESINMMSGSEDESDSESVGWSEDVAVLQMQMKQAVL